MATCLMARYLTFRSRAEDGATAVEYALMVTFIALVIIVAVLTLGNKLSSFFTEAATLV